MLVPFLCCGDMSGFDSERSHPLDGDAICAELREKLKVGDSANRRDPIAPPTEPAYKQAVSLKRTNQLAQPTGEQLSTQMND